MSDALKYDELDSSIERVLSRGEFASTGDEDLDAMARLASGLRGLPDPEFKARLRAELLPRAERGGWWPFRKVADTQGNAEAGRRHPLVAWIGNLLPAAPWSRRHRAFAAGGASCGLVAGACCISGATASVLGIASAAAVNNFIHSTIPYFVGLSIVSLFVWVAWTLRDQGVTPRTVGLTVRRHGLAMGSAYGMVFGASMALSMAMGLM